MARGKRGGSAVLITANTGPQRRSFPSGLSLDGSEPYVSHVGSRAVGVASPASAAARLDESNLKWDRLLLCIAAFIWTSVGRVHQLFPMLEVIRPAALTGAVALVLYLMEGGAHNRTHKPLAP